MRIFLAPVFPLTFNLAPNVSKDMCLICIVPISETLHPDSAKEATGGGAL